MNKDFMKFAIGLAAGAAVGYYLNSDKGRKARKKANAKASEYADDLKTNASEYAVTLKNNAADYANTLKETANEYAKVAKDNFNSLTDSVKDKIGTTFQAATEEVEKGVKEAENSINRTAGSKAKAV